MTKHIVGNWLELHRTEAQALHRTWRGSELRWSWGRLISFAAAVWVAVAAGDPPSARIIGVTSLVAIFALTVRRHTRARAQRKFADRLLLMIDETGLRLGGAVRAIRPHVAWTDGPTSEPLLEPMIEWGTSWPLTEQERTDLDVHGQPVGLFGLLNRSSTVLGSRRLREVLDNSGLSIDRIIARQRCVRWLDENPAARLRLMAGAAGLRDKDPWLERFVIGVRDAAPLPWSAWLVMALRLWSLPSNVFLLIAIEKSLAREPGWLAGLLAVFVTNCAIYWQMRRVLNERLKPWRDLAPVVGAFLGACRTGVSTLEGDSELKRLRSRFDAATERTVLPGLRWRLDWTNAGGTIHAILNVAMFYDLHVAAAVLGRVCPNRTILLESLSALADLEAMCGLGCFAWEQPVRCYPTPVEDHLLEIKGGVNPLIDPDRAVANDVDMLAPMHLYVVTGSNMAGKSTYLRMVGVNVLLAQIGSAVTAESMTWTPMRLMSDLCVSDSLSKNESYFLAEVRQVRRMLVPLPGDQPVLGLIDEPFRGTNSRDRVAASVAMVEQLMASGGFFIVATHEQTLTELPDGSRAANHHFEEQLGADGPVFNFRLLPGPVRGRNALLILEREGYPPAMVDRARRWLDGN